MTRFGCTAAPWTFPESQTDFKAVTGELTAIGLSFIRSMWASGLTGDGFYPHSKLCALIDKLKVEGLSFTEVLFNSNDGVKNYVPASVWQAALAAVRPVGDENYARQRVISKAIYAPGYTYRPLRAALLAFAKAHAASLPDGVTFELANPDIYPSHQGGYAADTTQAGKDFRKAVQNMGIELTPDGSFLYDYRDGHCEFAPRAVSNYTCEVGVSDLEPDQPLLEHRYWRVAGMLHQAGQEVICFHQAVDPAWFGVVPDVMHLWDGSKYSAFMAARGRRPDHLAFIPRGDAGLIESLIRSPFLTTT